MIAQRPLLNPASMLISTIASALNRSQPPLAFYFFQNHIKESNMVGFGFFCDRCARRDLFICEAFFKSDIPTRCILVSTRNWRFGPSASYTKLPVLTVVFNAGTLSRKKRRDTNKLLIVCPVPYKLKSVLFLADRSVPGVFFGRVN